MQRAFSLVELSIVLVILGLLTGGILAGQSLIRAAELRSVISDYQRYSAAFRSFQDRYMALPGDMATATRFWGIAGGATGSDSTCWDTTSTGIATCNGNGNGDINSPGGGTTDNWYYNERFRAWQHLANAGLIEGSFTGRTGTIGNAHRVEGSNVPASKISPAWWEVLAFAASYSGNAQLFDGNYGFQALLLAQTTGEPLRPEEAWNIDVKLDDGKPTGRVFAVKNTATWAPNCTTTDSPATSEYNLSNTSKLCLLFFALR